MAQVFVGRRTRRQIIDQALKKAGNTKIVGEARVELARVLETLYHNHAWPFLMAEASLSLVASTTLPSDFLEPAPQPDTCLQVTTIDGIENYQTVLLVTPEEWRRHAKPRNETGECPIIAMVDYRDGVLKTWPVAETAVVALFTYKALPAEVVVPNPDAPVDAEVTTYDANVPTFPHHGYLTDVIEAWALEYENDSLAPLRRQQCSQTLAGILAKAFPPSSAVGDSIPLDPALFGTPLRVHEE
jgi:hypothetical protein